MSRPVALNSLRFSDSDGNILVSEEYSIEFQNEVLANIYISKRHEYWQEIFNINLVVAPNMNETLWDIEIKSVIKLVARFFHISVRQLMNRRRMKENIEPRRFVVALCRERKKGYSMIARYLGYILKNGDPDHATCVYHYKKHRDLYDTDREYRKRYEQCETYVYRIIGGRYSEDGSGEKEKTIKN